MDITYNSNEFVSGTKDFLNSNSFIAKLSFIILVIICFVLLFNIGYWLLNILLTPSRSPYVIKGMKDAKTFQIIKQNPKDSNAVTIYRSNNQYNGIEFTWSSWIFIEDPTYNSSTFNNVFTKGSQATNSGQATGIFQGTNCPGVYLKPTGNTENIFEFDEPNSLTMQLLIRLDIFPYLNPLTSNLEYFVDLIIDKIPIKKWVSIIIRCSSQNIVDVFINGSLMNRIKLPSLIKQNYDNIYINANGGFDGFMSNLRYYNYAIGTFEIDKIINSGPNLTMEQNDITQSYPYYLSTKWLFGEKYT
tara:strand:+ start:4750 stop:5655 length:906 start_codon:yes stop_codon:yes gene_type:complete